MSNYDFIQPREKKRTLLIVEGQHEKYELMELLLKCFPEIYVKRENIEVFHTNIYILYEKIKEVYNEDWDEQDVDLVMLIRDIKHYSQSFKRSYFTDIIMIFDYERHDPNFSEDKICRMQKYFNDSIERGKLYINYPMVESYMHFPAWPDSTFANVDSVALIKRGDIYKNSLKGYFVAKLVNLPIKINEILRERFGVECTEQRNACVENLLSLCSCEDLEFQVEVILKDVICGNNLQTAKYQILDLLNKYNYCNEQCTYYAYMKKLFISIIRHNIYKAHKIQGYGYDIPEIELKAAYYSLDSEKILKEQNNMSRELDKIMVLNTSIFLITDYNFSLIEYDK